MLHSANYRFSNDKYLRTQRCHVPSSFLINSYIKFSDVVTINCGEYSYICRIFPLPKTKLEMYISIDDTVSYNSSSSDKHKQHLFCNDFKAVKPITFDKVQVKVVLHNENKFLARDAINCDIVHKLLRHYVIKRNSTVKCDGRSLASLFHIHSIVISETFQDINTFGRLARTAVVEIVEVISKEQLTSANIDNENIGGIEEPEKTLSGYLLQGKSRRVIVSGPSGCGKSLFVKKFCNDLKCSLIIIDGSKDDDLTINKCDMYSKQLLQSAKMFPNLHSILLIDNIDDLASINLKQQKKKFLASLEYLFKCLESSSVSIILITTQKKILHPAVSCLFEDEVFLGVPSFSQRREMLMALTRSFPNNHIEYDKIAAMTPGFLACDIAQLVKNVTSERKKTTSQLLDAVENGSLSTHNFEKALLSVTPSLLGASDWNMKVKPVCWSDIGGMDGIKKKLQLTIEKPLRNPEIFQKVDLHCPRGVLLFGPPGCCKTTLARGLATECYANFFAANPSQIYSSYVGESEKNISQLFYQARLCAPSIIFLDELDSLVGSRTFDTKQQGVSEKILSTLLSEMDGLGVKRSFGENDKSNRTVSENLEDSKVGEMMQLQDEVIVVGATNRPDCIDDALLRPGRFDIIMYVPPPNLEERVSILQTITKDMQLCEVDLRKIAEKTEYFTGADLKNVCNMAAMNALREHLLNAEYISEHNFIQALEKSQPSVTKEQIQMYEKLSNKYGPIISNK